MFEINKPKGNLQDFIEVNCDFCGSKDHEIILKSKDFVFGIVPGESNIVRCLNCNLVYTNPRLTSDALNSYYSKITKFGNYEEIKDINSKSTFLNKYLNRSMLTEYFNYPLSKKNIFKKIRLFPPYMRIRKKYNKSYTIPQYIKKGKILEIGCSYGTYLYLLRKLGWEVYGVELSDEAVRFARDKLKLNVQKKIPTNSEVKEKFDLIYLRMVLEHMESPKETLKQCYGLLKPKGRIILIIPDFSGLEVKLYKRYAYPLQVPYHLYHFTPNVIKNYLKLIDFKRIKMYHQNFDRDLIASLTFYKRENPNNKFAKILYSFLANKIVRKSLVKTLAEILSLIGKTSRMVVIAER